MFTKYHTGDKYINVHVSIQFLFVLLFLDFWQHLNSLWKNETTMQDLGKVLVQYISLFHAKLNENKLLHYVIGYYNKTGFDME